MASLLVVSKLSIRVLNTCLLVVFFLSACGKAKNNDGFTLETSNFSEIVMNSGFVDKTLLIKEIIEHNKTSVIAAPPKYGKSTNMDMIKTFFEVEVDEDGIRKTKANYLTEPVTDTVNYKLFNNSKLKISHEVSLMEEFFGRTPVMIVSFKCEQVIKDSADVLKYFQQVVHETFLKYYYLTKNNKLEDSQKRGIESWCDDEEYLTLDKQQVITGLRELSEYIYYYFDQRRVYVLVDDYDSPIRSAMSSVSDNDVLEEVIQLCASVTNTLLKRNARYVRGGMMTGVWDIPAVGTPVHNTKDPDSFQIHRFLDDHRFVNYYGATKQEVEELITNYKLKGSIEDITVRYNGYLSKKGPKIYNLYSILNFVQSGKLKNYWTFCNPKQYIKDIIKIPDVQNNITELLKNESVYIEAIEKLKVDDFLLLRNITTNPTFHVTDGRVFFFLFAEGYFTYKSGILIYIDKDPPKVGIRCPNDEIKEYFENAIRCNLAEC